MARYAICPKSLKWIGPFTPQGGAAPTNLIHHHAVDIDVPIACGGVPVYPGDVVVGDDEGVVIIPRHLADEVAEDAEAQDRFESFVLDEVRAGNPSSASIRPMMRPKSDTNR